MMRGDGRDGFGVGEVIGGQREAQLGPVVLQDEEQLGGGQRSVFVDEPDPAVELRVPGETFFDAGHTDQDHAEAAAVVVVAELLQGRGLEPVGLVDDEQLNE